MVLSRNLGRNATIRAEVETFGRVVRRGRETRAEQVTRAEQATDGNHQ